MKIGIGYDVHKLAKNRPLIIGGVDIPFYLGLLGHSDADVLSHAVADAILGAAKAGDIGKLFPDTDPQYKGANSLDLLKLVANHVRSLGYKIVDVDSIIVAQSPKMAPYREAMRKNIASTLNVSTKCVGVKATTTEGTGPEGKSETISAKAVCLLESINKC